MACMPWKARLKQELVANRLLAERNCNGADVRATVLEKRMACMGSQRRGSGGGAEVSPQVRLSLKPSQHRRH
jgi:hypothetical protein